MLLSSAACFVATRQCGSAEGDWCFHDFDSKTRVRLSRVDDFVGDCFVSIAAITGRSRTKEQSRMFKFLQLP